MKRKFTVKVVIPAGMDEEDMRSYIEDAVGTWMGQYHPEDPRFHIDRETLEVKIG